MGQVPAAIHYQAFLTDETGQPVDGVVSATFGLYRNGSQIDPLWSQSQQVLVDNGLMSVLLGAPHAHVSGGQDNVADGDWSSILGGVTNFASGADSVIVAGRDNTTLGDEAAVVVGNDNRADADRAVVTGGEGNTAGGVESVVSGGANRATCCVHDWRAGSLFESN